MRSKPQTAGRIAPKDWKEILLSHLGDQNLTPCVRYGTKERKQCATLRTVSQPSPPKAVTVGPIYFVDEDQLTRQKNLENPYKVKGSACIAQAIQNECEGKGRVLYPIYVESDSLEEASRLDTMIPVLQRFTEDSLNVSPGECSWWYSGNRSIHVHTPLFVTEAGREVVRRAARQFNESEGSGVQLDSGIYDRKRQFRLPGIKHESNGLRKVRIETGWTHNRIFREAVEADICPPRSYTELLSEVLPTTGASPLQYVARTPDIAPVEPESGTGIDSLYINPISRVRLKEGKRPPGNSTEREIFLAYNAKEFSPYAKTGGDNGRSVAVVKVYSRAFCRPEYSRDARLPCYFLHAIGGCRTFTKSREYAPLLLSTPDYCKSEEVKPGSYLVIIGGRSRRSRIFEVDIIDAVLTAGYLQDNGRQSALKYLLSKGYEVGSPGLCEGRSGGSSVTRTKTHELQEKAERRGIGALSHDGLLKVGNRLLQVGGWEAAWDWFQVQFGDNFSPNETHRYLRSIVNKYDDLAHVEVPPLP